MFSALKSIAVIFPILTGAVLTGMGSLKLSEANLVPVDQWSIPYGLLTFSSVQLETQAVGLLISLGQAGVEENLVSTHLELKFVLAEPDRFKNVQEEVVIGFQCPFKIADYQEFEIRQGDDPPFSPITRELIVVEDEIEVTSVFYVRFNTFLELESQQYSISLVFEWEGPIRREGFSVFTIALPFTLGLEPSTINYPYQQIPNIHYVYYAENLGYSISMEFPWDFEIKQSYPPTGTAITEFGSDALCIFWEPEISAEGKGVSGKLLQVFMVEFEVTSLSEVRDKLLFDSGLYMGLGVGLLFSGIHEALIVIGELRKKKEVI